jgi:membrane fusion protein (multidrug efflux system)
MDTTIENNGLNQFADRQPPRDSRANVILAEPDAFLDLDTSDLLESPRPGSRLDALQPGVIEDRPRIELNDGAQGQQGGASNGNSRFNKNAKRLLLIGLLIFTIGAVSPFVWNYLQSYQSTDDAEIDGHIDPLSSRIDGTVIRVHPDDDDRVRKGDLLVEIDPRDYQVAVEQAQAHLELALAQIASAKQDYAAALANVREAEASNFRAQRDASRYAILLNQQVVAQEQYDQFTAIARVDSAKVDSARQAAGSVMKTIAARQADADAAKAALDQALLNLSYTKIYAPANGIVGQADR